MVGIGRVCGRPSISEVTPASPSPRRLRMDTSTGRLWSRSSRHHRCLGQTRSLRRGTRATTTSSATAVLCRKSTPTCKAAGLELRGPRLRGAETQGDLGGRGMGEVITASSWFPRALPNRNPCQVGPGGGHGGSSAGPSSMVCSVARGPARRSASRCNTPTLSWWRRSTPPASGSSPALGTRPPVYRAREQLIFLHDCADLLAKGPRADCLQRDAVDQHVAAGRLQ